MFHPEYCYYLYCEKDTASNRYDADIESTTTFTAAMAAGFFNPLDDSHEVYTINWNDPYFAHHGYGQVDSTLVRTKLEKYLIVTVGLSTDTLSLWQAAALAIYLCGRYS